MMTVHVLQVDLPCSGGTYCDGNRSTGAPADQGTATTPRLGI